MKEINSKFLFYTTHFSPKNQNENKMYQGKKKKKTSGNSK